MGVSPVPVTELQAPEFFAPFLNLLPAQARSLWMGPGVGTMDGRMLPWMLVGQAVHAGQIFASILLAASLYRWYAARQGNGQSGGENRAIAPALEGTS